MPEPITTITVATAAAWLWDKFGDSATDKAKEVAQEKVGEKWKHVKWNAAAEKYRAKIKMLYGTMQVLGMPEPVPLSEIYVDAYVLSKQTALQRFALEELLARAGDPEKRHSAERKGCLALVREKGNLFILGKPGAGKTTFMKRVAFNSAEGNIDKVPIFISLKEWSDSKLDLMPFIAQQFEICAFPEARPFVEKLLASGNAIVLFDGLDEVNQADGLRLKQVQAMQNFIKKYDATQCLITCRLAANEYTFENFKYVEMADFDDGQVQQFVKNWFRNDERIGDRFLEEFANEENRNLRELASSPLLLTLLCLSYQETLVFPQRRVEIYEEAMDALLKKWDSSRGIKRDSVYGKLSLGHKKKMFAQVAAITFEKNEYFIRKEALQKELVNYVVNVPPHDEEMDGEVLLQTIEAQHGIFTARSRDYHSFSHLTFQEYFTARYIVDNIAKGTLRALLGHCGEQRWREVFLNTVCLLDDASNFLIEFEHKLDDHFRQFEKIVGFLDWAQLKSVAGNAPTRIIREVYIQIGLREVRAQVHVPHFHLKQDSVKYPDIKRAINEEKARTKAQATDLHILLVNTAKRIFTFDLAFVEQQLIASNQLHPALDLALSIARTQIPDAERALEIALECTEKLNLIDLKKEILKLDTPNFKMQPNQVEAFQHDLLFLMIRYRGIGRRILITKDEMLSLISYLNANDLLKSCLDLGTMPLEKKEAILDRLFLPPTQG